MVRRMRLRRPASQVLGQASGSSPRCTWSWRSHSASAFERLDESDPIVLTSALNASSATSALSALASGMIAFTGFVTSVVLLVVQFGTGEFSPPFTTQTAAAPGRPETKFTRRHPGCRVAGWRGDISSGSGRSRSRPRRAVEVRSQPFRRRFGETPSSRAPLTYLWVVGAAVIGHAVLCRAGVLSRARLSPRACPSASLVGDHQSPAVIVGPPSGRLPVTYLRRRTLTPGRAGPCVDPAGAAGHGRP